MYLWEEINSKLQMYPFHPPGSSATHRFLVRLDVHITFVWVLPAVAFCIPPLCSIPWCYLNRPSFLSVMISGLTSICEDGLHSYSNPWFKIHSRPVSYFFTHSSVQIRYLYFHLFDVLNAARDLACGVWFLKTVRFWNIPGEDPIYHSVSTSFYLFIYFSWDCTFLVMLTVPLTRSIPPVP